MGFAGMFFNDTVHRITGLDPARPLFELPPMLDDCRLSRDDAGFVDIIHTCAGVYGYMDSHGQADFYPNGAKPPQPGCGGHEPAPASCSHGRAYEFFIESLKDGTPFISYPCESYEEFENGNCRVNTSLMGEPASEESYGDYYLHTGSESPYALGDEFNETDGQE
ncbi:lipase member H-A-like [Choristoneura fumiferana]|uniref:lipase member H-A-like n=1 Tax=Choristoneura fumiferana TaxID=7141 RepID=UPI003D154E86